MLHIILFIFILWICTGLQNPYGYGNSQVCLRNLEVQSIQKCTIILVTRSSTIISYHTIFEVLT
jgi:hypothetical protein